MAIVLAKLRGAKSRINDKACKLDGLRWECEDIGGPFITWYMDDDFICNWHMDACPDVPEPYENVTWNCIMSRSRPRAVAEHIFLFNMFGGFLKYNDHVEGAIMFKAPQPRRFNNPQDGVPWVAFHKRLNEIRPLSDTAVKLWTKDLPLGYDTDV